MIIFLLLLLDFSYAQKCNEYITSGATDDHIWNAFSYENEHYLIMSSGIFEDFNTEEYLVKGYKNYIIKLDNNLNTVDSVFIDSIPGYNSSYFLPEIKTDTLYLFGYAITGDMVESQIVLSKFLLPDLILIETHIFGQENIRERVNDVIFEKDSCFTLSVNNMTDMSHRSQIIMRVSRSGNDFFYKNDTSIKVNWSTIYKMQSTKDYIFNSSLKTIVYDSSITNYFEQLNANFNYRYTGKKVFLNDSVYIIGGDKYKLGSSDIYTDISYYLVNDNLDYFDSGYIILPDSSDNLSSFILKDSVTLIYGGTHNKNWSMQTPGLFEEEDRWVVLKSENIITKHENWVFVYGGF